MWRIIGEKIKGFSRDARGNVALIVALSALPILGLAGISLDYGFMLAVRSKITQAADAAAVAAVAGAQTYLVSYTGTGDPTSAATTAGQQQGMAQFNANLGSMPANGTFGAPTVTVTRSGQVLQSAVTYTFSMPTFFSWVLGEKNLSFSGSTSSTLTMPTYVNIYIILDISESMGIGATAADQQTVYNATGGCAVACHFAGSDTEPSAHAAGATLRIDVAKSALASALSEIPANSNYKVSVYTMTDKFTNVFSLSNNISGAVSAIQGVDLAADNDDGGTDTTFALKTLASQLPATGDGLTPATAQGFVLLVTDGVQDSDEKVYQSGSYVDANDPSFTVFSPCNQSSCEYDGTFGIYMESMDPSKCTAIKSAGYTLMTLNVQYLIPSVSLQGGNSALQDVFTYIQSYLLGSITSNMTSCATSASNAYSANTPAQITTALAQIFNAIPLAAQARITQ